MCAQNNKRDIAHSSRFEFSYGLYFTFTLLYVQHSWMGNNLKLKTTQHNTKHSLTKTKIQYNTNNNNKNAITEGP